MQTRCLCVLVGVWVGGGVGTVEPVLALQWGVLLTIPEQWFFCGSCVFSVSLCASVYMCFVVLCWEGAGLLASGLWCLQ